MEHAPVADRIETAAPAPGPDPTGPAASGCPFPHGGPAPAPAPEVEGEARSDAGATAAAAARCPVPHEAAAPAAGCPVLHGPGGVRRTPADLVVRKLLRIKDRPAGVTEASAYGTFQRSMLISATRCSLTYVVFPFVLPAAGFARGVGPVIGIIIGSIALACDTFTIRRFFAVDHKWRWHFSAIAFAIMCLLSVLLVQDVAHIVGSLRT